MANTIRLTALDGSPVEFVDEPIGSGAMKEAFFTPDKKHVVCFFFQPQDTNTRERLKNIVGRYRQNIFEGEGGDYWKGLFCWPEKIVEWNGRLGIVTPAYDRTFYFTSGIMSGKEKEGKWFASARLRTKFVPKDELGSWLTHFHMCIQMARAVKRLHAAGLAHSDLSYKNVLVDPRTGRAAIIDCDGLVVPGKYPPDVVGTPDFIAPEVLQTKALKLGDPNKKLPSILTDRHALAVLIYMYLLYRHPLRGGKVNDLDAAKDEELSMGAKALFVEHPTDRSNRPKLSQLRPEELPFGDVDKLPYTICGPLLKPLFDRAFIDGLHNPSMRPNADEWVTALVRTTDLMQPCNNPSCRARWYVFDNTRSPRCPFCGTPYKGELPVIDLYYSPRQGSFKPEGYRLMVYSGQSLYRWHVNRFVSPNEKLSAEEKKPVGDFHLLNERWILINRRLSDLYEILPDGNNRLVAPGEYIELTEGKKFLLSKEDGGRLALVTLANK